MPLPHKIGVDVWSEVVLPASLEERYELLDAWYAAQELPEHPRVLAAALALCWPLLRAHMSAQRVEFTGRVLAYGKAVMDALLTNEDPADRNAVIRAGRDAIEAVRTSVATIAGAAIDPEGFGKPAGSPGSGGSSSPSSGGATSDPGSSGPSQPPSSQS